MMEVRKINKEELKIYDEDIKVILIAGEEIPVPNDISASEVLEQMVLPLTAYFTLSEDNTTLVIDTINVGLKG